MDLKKINDEKELNLRKLLADSERSSKQQLTAIQKIQDERILSFNQQMQVLNKDSKNKDDLLASYKARLSNLQRKQSENGSSILIAVILAIIIGLVVGFVLGKK